MAVFKSCKTGLSDDCGSNIQRTRRSQIKFDYFFLYTPCVTELQSHALSH